MANFNYYLNRQGVRGQKGEKGDKGDKGFSPYIDIKENTPTEFTLTVHNEEESFDTPNLIPTAIGEKVTEMEVTLNTHTEDIRNLKLEDQRINSTVSGIQNSLGVVDAQIEAVNQRIDNQSYKIADLEIEVNNLSGEVASNSADITSIKNINTTQDSEIAKLKQKDGAIEESIDDLNHKYTTLGSEISDLSIKKQNKLVAGSNITLTDNPTDGTTTISSTGGEGGSPLDNFIEGSTNDNTTTISVKNGKALKLDAPTISVGNNLVNNTDSDTMQLYLKQGDIDAGDNVTVERTATGVRISSTGGAGDIPIATTEVAGKVKPDGTTITVTEDGTISATGGGSVPDNVALKDTTNTFTEPQRFEGSSSVIRIASDASDSAYGQINRPNAESVNIQPQYGSPASLLISTSGLTYIDSNGVNRDLLASSTPTNMVTTDTNQGISGTKTFALEGFSASSLSIGKEPNGAKYGLIFRSVNTAKNFVITNNGYSNSSLAIGNFEKEITLNAKYGNGTLRIGGEADSLTFIKKDNTVVDLLAGGTGDVTAAGNNTFTGKNFFKNEEGLCVSGESEYGTVANYDDTFYNSIDINGTPSVNQVKGGVLLGSDYNSSTLKSDVQQLYYSTTNAKNYRAEILNTGNFRAGEGITIKRVETDYDADPIVPVDSYFEISATGGGGSAPTNMVTTDTIQTISAQKRFSNSSGIILGNPAGLTGSITASNLYLASSGAAALTVASGTNAKIEASTNANRTLELRTYNSQMYMSKDGIFLKPSQYNDTANRSCCLFIGDDSLEYTKADGTIINLLSGSSGSSDTSDEYGIRADYAVRHGIIDNPNGIISYSATNKDITVNQGLVLNCAGNGSAKTTIATAMTHTVTSTGAFTLFYANGNLLECGKVDYSTKEPEDNGVDNYQAWFNPDKTANPDQQWQFKSNDTGNVFRFVNSATPLADFVAGETSITSVSYLGYRVLDDDILALKSDIPDKETISHISSLSNSYTTLTLGASGVEYTAPNDGLFYIGITPVATNEFIRLEIRDSAGEFLYANRLTRPSATSYFDLCIQVSKGNILRIESTVSAATSSILRFFPNNVQ